MPSELNLNSLHTSLTGINICYPKCGDNGQMEFHLVNDLSEMNPSAYGILEPNVSLDKKLDSEEIDLFLCPAYAFTRDGKRLGKGGGYYDRYLLKKRPDAITLGIAFPCQIIDQVPTDKHDLLVDRVL